jgi:hypothetical protein
MVRLPWELEQLTLRTTLSISECAERLAGATLRWDKPPCPAVFPVRGLITTGRFYLGRSASRQSPPRTWLRGRLLEADTNTRVDVTIGPNPFLGFVIITLFAMLIAGAMVLSWLALTTSITSPRMVGAAWLVVGVYGALFFIAPALDYGRERRFLVSFVEHTLEAVTSEERT